MAAFTVMFSAWWVISRRNSMYMNGLGQVTEVIPEHDDPHVVLSLEPTREVCALPLLPFPVDLLAHHAVWRVTVTVPSGPGDTCDARTTAGQ
jgi:hypothetical protein